MRNLLIYRDHLLPKSEHAFMRRQYLGFTQLAPVWVGRRLLPDFAETSFTHGPILSGPQGLAFKLLGHIPHRKALEALNPVAVHAQFGRGGALALPLAQALGIPLVVTFHGGDAHKSAHWRPHALQRLRLNAMLAYASALLCVSQGVRDRLVARGVPAEKLHILPIGVEITPQPPRRPAAILFIGRFVEMKGVPVLLEAVRQRRAQGDQTPLILIGDGPDRPALEAAASGLPHIEFRGWQSQAQIAAALSEARLLCVPSVVARSGEAEGLPSVAVEAMRAGVPVIASSDAGTAGLIRPGENGLVFPSRDSAALAALLADGAIESLGPAARATVVAEFDAMRQSEKLERILLKS